MEQFLQRYMYSWRFNGWFFHDITLGIVLGIGFLALVLLIINRTRLKVILIVMLIWLGASNFAMLIFGLAGRGFSIQAESAIYTNEEQDIAIQMVRGLENNGTVRGMTQMISHYLIVGVDVQTGEKQWTKSASYKEKLVGNFMDGLLVHHRDGEFGQLSLLDIETGKELLSEKEFRQQHKPLIDILSNGAHELLAVQNNLYVEGVDGKFYRYDGKNLNEDPQAEQYLTTRFSIEATIPDYFANHQQPLTDDEEIRKFSSMLLEEPAIQAYQNLNPKVIDVDIEAQTALVSYQQTKRESADHMLVLYDLNKHQIAWDINIGMVDSYQKQPSVRIVDDAYIVQTGDHLLIVDKDTRNIRATYHLRWNRPIS
ncbi:PA2928 family protein [Lysinibacillus sp. FSL K6-0232]|uniref:PA2928 family protein n=1 Tax=unclassified Lysinibacillus TaxID=2636778 RepID=UPI0030F95351